MLKFFKQTCIIVTFIGITIGYAQNEIDSLSQELIVVDNIQDKIDLFLKIGQKYIYINPDSANLYINKAKISLMDSPSLPQSANYYKIKGLLLHNKLDVDLAISHFRTSYYLFDEIGNIKEKNEINGYLGNCYKDLQKYDSALYYYGEVLLQIDSVKYTLLLADNFNNMGYVYDTLGENVFALDNYINAFTLYRRLGQNQKAASAIVKIAAINQELGNCNTSILYLKKAINLNIDMGNNYELCTNYLDIGTAYMKTENYDSSIYYNLHGVSIAKDNDFFELEAKLTNQIGESYLEMGESKKALRSFEKSLKISKDNWVVIGEIYNLYGIGKVNYNISNLVSAEAYTLKSLELSKSTGANIILKEIYQLLFNIFNDSRKLDKAIDYYRMYNNVKDSIHKIEQNQKLKDIEAKHELEQRDLENQQLKNKNKLQEFVIFRQRLLVFIALLVAIIAIGLMVTLYILRKNRKKRIAMLQNKNKQIREKSEQLKVSNETKDKLFSIIAHDLRSPFTSLLGFSSLLKEETELGNFENAAKYSNQLNATAVSTYELIDNLLNWSRSQQNNLVSTPQPLLLSETVQEVMLSLGIVANEKRVSVISKIEDDIEVLADKNMLLVVIRNLISNAIKFTYKDGKVVIVKIQLKTLLFL